METLIALLVSLLVASANAPGDTGPGGLKTDHDPSVGFP